MRHPAKLFNILGWTCMFFLIKSSSNHVSFSWYDFIIFDCIIISAVKTADTSYIFNQNIYRRAKWFTILENQFIGNLEFFFWVNGQKYENFPQFNTDWLVSLRMWNYFRLCFSFSCSGYDLTVTHSIILNFYLFLSETQIYKLVVPPQPP